MTVVITGGGTGGHTSPGLAVAAALARRHVDCVWIGSRDGIEARRALEAKILFHAIPTGKLRRSWAWKNVTDLAIKVPSGVGRALWVLGQLRPDAAFATGGFVAVPVVLAAALRRIPIVIHEQTSVPGIANRLAAHVAARVAVTFPESSSSFSGSDCVVTGNPLRDELRAGVRARAFERFGLDPAVPLLYVTGGAQGAHRINRAVGEALEGLLRVAQIVHQSGANPETGDLDWLEARRSALPAALRDRYRVVPFVGPELGDLYAAVVLVVGRAGAGTVSECCQLGLPAVFIPLPSARGSEQQVNAEIVARAGGAVVLPESALSAERLVTMIGGLLETPARLKAMGGHAHSLARPDAAERLADLVVEAARGGRP